MLSLVTALPKKLSNSSSRGNDDRQKVLQLLKECALLGSRRVESTSPVDHDSNLPILLVEYVVVVAIPLVIIRKILLREKGQKRKVLLVSVMVVAIHRAIVSVTTSKKMTTTLNKYIYSKLS